MDHQDSKMGMMSRNYQPLYCSKINKLPKRKNFIILTKLKLPDIIKKYRLGGQICPRQSSDQARIGSTS
jgi:hypothetical protein